MDRAVCSSIFLSGRLRRGTLQNELPPGGKSFGPDLQVPLGGEEYLSYYALHLQLTSFRQVIKKTHLGGDRKVRMRFRYTTVAALLFGAGTITFLFAVFVFHSCRHVSGNRGEDTICTLGAAVGI